MGQNEGGWAIPFRTVGAGLSAETMMEPAMDRDPSLPFSHMVTGVALRAFAASIRGRTAPEAGVAGELPASRFFRRDAYPDRHTREYWTGFSFPFLFTDLLSAMHSVSHLGLSAAHPQAESAVRWFAGQQQPDGLWQLHVQRGKDKALSLWLSLYICITLKRLLG